MTSVFTFRIQYNPGTSRRVHPGCCASGSFVRSTTMMRISLSQASTKILEGLEGTWVSYGYDRVRFPAPLFFGDTVTVTYEVAERNEAERKVFSRVTVTTDRGALVAAATHILKRVDV